jgi:hypothetical protein
MVLMPDGFQTNAPRLPRGRDGGERCGGATGFIPPPEEQRLSIMPCGYHHGSFFFCGVEVNLDTTTTTISCLAVWGGLGVVAPMHC